MLQFAKVLNDNTTYSTFFKLMYWNFSISIQRQTNNPHFNHFSLIYSKKLKDKFKMYHRRPITCAILYIHNDLRKISVVIITFLLSFLFGRLNNFIFWNWWEWWTSRNLFFFPFLYCMYVSFKTMHSGAIFPAALIMALGIYFYVHVLKNKLRLWSLYFGVIYIYIYTTTLECVL